MKLDVQTYGQPLTEVADAVRDLQDAGYAAWMTSETEFDPFLAAATAALATDRIDVGTGIAVAFSRNPMTVAYQAQNIQQALGADRRFLLGLGSQIRPHIVKRFSQPWPERPAAAMRDFVHALHAIWDCWNDGAELAFTSEHYAHTLMTPMFAPSPTPVRPRVLLAAVGPGMTRVTGEVADGILCHAFTTAAYLRQTTLPALQEGIARTPGRTREDVEVCLPFMTITGYDAAGIAEARGKVLQQISFYGSTPAYRPVLQAHGWEELGEQLTAMSKRGEWEAMAASIPEEVVDAFAVTAEPDELGEAILARLDGLVDRVTLPDTMGLTPAHTRRLAEVLAGA